VRALQALRTGPACALNDVALTGALRLPARGTTLELEARIAPGAARRVGVAVRVGEGERTTIAYDAGARELAVDRTRSGVAGFSPHFAAVHQAPLELGDGTLVLRVLVDRSSVEVFAGRGERTITDLVFPRLSSDGVELFAEGGTARVLSLVVWPLRAAR
jgi:sucrose-6-phosphate hydrolase SacC (GH32 family)